jgi:hypothetical protein
MSYRYGMSGTDIETTAASNDEATHALDDLDDLDRAYGQDYDLAVARGHWLACRLRTGQWFVASCAAELRRLIMADAALR